MSRLTYIAVPALLAIWLVAGCGVKKEVHQKALDDLVATQSELSKVKKKNKAQAKRIEELEEKLLVLTEARDEISGKLELTEKEKAERIAQLKKDMQATKEELVALRKQQEKTQERLKAYAELNNRFRSLVDTGKLEVAFRNGQMVIKLPSGVLFPSGRAKLSKAGEAALTEVLDILKEFKDRRLLVAGHTDNVAIRSRRFKNNWYLSTARAVSVLEFMIEAGFDPKNVAAAGYGEFDPVAPNDSEENRALNRRIEIIFVPDLSELPNLTGEPKS